MSLEIAVACSTAEGSGNDRASRMRGNRLVMRTCFRSMIFAVIGFKVTMFIPLLICTIIAAKFFLAMPADAARCGGLNQKPCHRPLSGYTRGCKHWFQLKRGRCRPCGGSDQIACRISGQGMNCRPGLLIKGHICKKIECGREGERACNANERVPGCDRPFVEINSVCLKRI